MSDHREEAEKLAGPHDDDCTTQHASYVGEPCECDRRDRGAAIESALERAVKDRDAHVLSVLTDLQLSPGEGPYFITLDHPGADPRPRAVQPREVEGVFRAFREALGGYEALQAWRKRELQQAEAKGFAKGVEAAVNLMNDWGTEEKKP